MGECGRSAAAGLTQRARDGRPNEALAEVVLLNPAESSRRAGSVPASSHSKRSQIAIPPNQTQTP